jgi:RimJ/RimL family protein N-acetyltransferase
MLSLAFCANIAGVDWPRRSNFQTILLAKHLGMRYIRTDNDSHNAPMLAVNRKLGYQSESSIYRLLSALPVK